MIGHARAERVVLLALRGRRARALLGFISALAGLLADLAHRVRRGARCVTGDLAAARTLGEALELVGHVVDRLQVALVLVLLAGWRNVGVPALGHAPARELHVAHIEGRLQLQKRHRLLEIEHRCHELFTLSDAHLIS